jgi:hypothetical protein
LPTNSEEVVRLAQSVTRIETILEERSARLSADVALVRTDVARVQTSLEALTTGLAVVQQRCAAMEKAADRGWQLAPLVLSGLAIVVSLVVALLKK